MTASYDVFLCHATADKDDVEFLANKLNTRDLRCFLDKWNLIPGDPIQPKLQQALKDSDCCAVFIGPEAKGPWQHQEIQSALRKQVAESAFRVIPVQLPGAPDLDQLDDDLSFLSNNLGVDFRDGLDNEQVLYRLACGIRGQPPGPDSAQHPHASAGPNAGGELSIHLRLTDPDNPRLYFFTDSAALLGDLPQQPLTLRFPPTETPGNELYRILFHHGPEDLWPRIRSEIIGQAAVGNPSRYPLRLRLHLDHPKLAALPWSRLCWEDQDLKQMGWVIELTDEPEEGYWPGDRLALNQHCGVLLIVPDRQAFDTDAHARMLLRHFQDIWSKQDQLHIAHDTDGIRQSLQRIKAGIVYFFGRAECHDEELILRSETGDFLMPLAELERLWRRPPQIVFLNLLIDPAQREAVIWSARHCRVPLVIVQCASHGDDRDYHDAHRYAVNWFEALLKTERGINPAKLVHRHAHPTAVAWCEYGKWHIDLPDSHRNQVRERLARLMLDREDQRRTALDVTLAMFNDDSKLQMSCFLCYGGPSDMGGWFGRQIKSYLRRRTRNQLIIKDRPCLLPPGNKFTREDVRNGFFRAFDTDSATKPAALLLAVKRKQPGNQKLTLILDWQVRALDKPQQGLTTTALRNWLSFCAGELASGCPQGMRLLGFLVVEGPPDRRDRLQEVFSSLEKEFNAKTDRLHVETLDPLDHVDEEHIRKYLMEVDCPRELRNTLPALILRETVDEFENKPGNFEKTVRLLDEQRRRMTWPSFEQWLRQRQGGIAVPVPPASGDDEDDEPL